MECGVCQQAWEVPEPLYSQPGFWIILPPHEFLSKQTNEPMAGVPCAGTQLPGLGMGLRSIWEQNWKWRHKGRPLPPVKDGATSVKVWTG